jgi:two-component system sensor histidine kinase HydH
MSLARWGWMLTTLALGLAVFGSAWASWRSTERTAAETIRGQAQIFLHATIAASRNAAPSERSAALDSVVETHRSGGLRFAALARPDGTMFASAGEPPALPIGPLDSLFLHIARIGPHLFRMSLPARGLHLRGAATREPIVLVEFEPVLAETLTARVRDTVLLAGLVALVLVAAGLQFWRVSQREQQRERHLLEQRRFASLGQMSAVLAHEIRNPLASLKGHAQLVVERLPEGAPERRNATRVVTEATRLEALTSDLLEFARSGPMDVRSVDPTLPLREGAADAGLQNFEIARDTAPADWPLDARRLRLVLANILQNAVQAAPATHPPAGSISLERGRLVYTVRDFGPGLPAGQEEHIFDPFFTTRASGTGLGLAVARRIVELHGGRISASNATGGGAQFRIELPHQDGAK